MRRIVTLAASIVATVLSAVAIAGPSIGQPAPPFSAIDSNGKSVSLADFKGQTVVLEWTNDGCPFVQKHYGSGNMQSLQKAFAARNVVWLSVISSAPGQQGHVDGRTANQLSTSRGAAPTAVLLDANGAVGHLYDAKTTPQMFVVDARGLLAYAGGIDSIPTADPADIARATPYLKLAVESVQAGKPVMTPVTKPYGCSVKYG